METDTTFSGSGGTTSGSPSPAPSPSPSSTKPSSSSDGSKSGNGSGGGNGKLEVGETVTYTGGWYYYDSYGTDPAGQRGPGKKVKIHRIIDDPNRPYPISVISDDSAYGWLKAS